METSHIVLLAICISLCIGGSLIRREEAHQHLFDLEHLKERELEERLLEPAVRTDMPLEGGSRTEAAKGPLHTA